MKKKYIYILIFLSLNQFIVQSMRLVKISHQFKYFTNWLMSNNFIEDDNLYKNSIFKNEEALIKRISQKNENISYADKFNAIEKSSERSAELFTTILITTIEVLKEEYEAELKYLREKRKVYFIHMPKNKKPLKTENADDLKDAMQKVNINLVFNNKQTKELLFLFNKFKTNAIKNKAHRKTNPKHYLMNPFTTQVFFSGPPGTGKTQIIYLISEILGTPIVFIKSSSLLLMGSQSIRVISELLDDAKLTGVILYIDEAELLLMNRSSIFNLRSSSGDKNKNNYSDILQKLFTTFLSKTGNKHHNLIISSNKIDILDKAMARRLDQIIYMEPPDNFTISRLVLSNLKKNNIKFIDMTDQEVADLVVIYNEKLKTINKNIQFSHSDITVIMSSLKQYNKPIIVNNQDIYEANRNQLEIAIKDKIHLYELFGFSIDLSAGGGVIGEEDYVDVQLNKLRQKAREEYDERLSINNKIIRQKVTKILYENKDFDGYFFNKTKNFYNLNNLNLNLFNISDFFLQQMQSKEKRYFHLYKFPSAKFHNYTGNLSQLPWDGNYNPKKIQFIKFPQASFITMNSSLQDIFYTDEMNNQMKSKKKKIETVYFKAIENNLQTDAFLKITKEVTIENLNKNYYEIDTENSIYEMPTLDEIDTIDNLSN